MAYVTHGSRWQKVAPRAFQLMHLRDITRHHQQLFVGIRHDANFEMPPGVEHQIERARKITRFQILRKLRVTQQVKDVLPVIFLPAQNQESVAPDRYTRKYRPLPWSAPLRRAATPRRYESV